MTMAYLGDENLPGPFVNAIRQHNSTSGYPIDFLTVGQPTDLPLGSDDPTILEWIETFGRILVTLDRRTMPKHCAAHLRAGRHIPGVFFVQPRAAIPDVLEFLVAAAYASDLIDWQDLHTDIP